MTYEKIEEHQAFLKMKGEENAAEKNIYKSNRRNKRLMKLNTLIMEQLISLNRETMRFVFK